MKAKSAESAIRVALEENRAVSAMFRAALSQEVCPSCSEPYAAGSAPCDECSGVRATLAGETEGVPKYNLVAELIAAADRDRELHLAFLLKLAGERMPPGRAPEPEPASGISLVRRRLAA
jgi:hypothetical protein